MTLSARRRGNQTRAGSAALLRRTNGRYLPPSPPEVQLASTLARLVAQQRPLEALRIIERSSLALVPPRLLRRLARAWWRLGYLTPAIDALEHLVELRDNGRDVASLAAARSAESVLTGEGLPRLADRSATYEAVPGRVLLVVPSRTEFSVGASQLDARLTALRELGLDPVLVVLDHQDGRSPVRAAPTIVPTEHLAWPDPTSPALEAAFVEFVEAFYTQLRKARPAVVHQIGDPLTAFGALAASRSLGVAFIYERRETALDTWARWVDLRHGHGSASSIVSRYGAADVAERLAGLEELVVTHADHAAGDEPRVEQRVQGISHPGGSEAHPGDTDLAADVTVYDAVGALSPFTKAVAFLPSRPDAGELRAAFADRAPLPFELLTSQDRARTADEIMSSGWTHGPYPRLRLDLPMRWSEAAASDRSWSFQLHAWSWIGPVLRAYEVTKKAEYLRWAVDRVLSWAHEYTRGTGAGTMAWYDMALGLRGHRLAFVIEQAMLADYPDDEIGDLLALAVRHQREYTREEAFKATSNHGFYVALGQAAFARRLAALPGMDAVAQQAQERLIEMVQQQFAPDGGHVEHSPEYHRMLLDSFTGAIDAGLITSPAALERIGKAAEVLGWFIQPDGLLVQFGDTHRRDMLMAPRAARQASPSPYTRFLMTRGEDGEPNPETMALLDESGYAIVRSPQPAGRDDHASAGYLALMAGFHSRTHKHADDLSVVWFDRSSEILIDAGRFGYVDPLPANSPLRREGFYYASPQRQHVESTWAHNTVSIDERSHDRRRAPYGSGLVSGDQQDGWYRIEATAPHGTITHRRTLLFRPSETLVIIDEVNDEAGDTHRFDTWLNFPAEHAISAHDNCLEIVLASGETLWVSELSGTSLRGPVQGQEQPLRGWRSPDDYEFVPCWTASYSVAGTTRHRFVTVLTFAGGPATDVPPNPFGESMNEKVTVH